MSNVQRQRIELEAGFQNRALSLMEKGPPESGPWTLDIGRWTLITPYRF